jgi:aldose 1-epimerase
LTLGIPDFDSYPAHSPYFGQTPGRHANRIAKGPVFRLDGIDYQLELNERGRHASAWRQRGHWQAGVDA